MMNPKKIRNGMNPVERVIHPTGTEMVTQQSMKDETDVNTIVSHYLKTGYMPQNNEGRQPQFGDFSSVDFMRMRNVIADVDQAFLTLPASIRKRFNNDPYQVVRFVENPANRAEAEKLGLLSVSSPPKSSPKPVDPNQQDLAKQASQGPVNPSTAAVPSKAPLPT